MTLKVDPERVQYADTTGIYVRAQYGKRWTSADIATLDAASLHAWLRADGGNNPMAERVVEQLLGHPPAPEPPDVPEPTEWSKDPDREGWWWHAGSRGRPVPVYVEFWDDDGLLRVQGTGATVGECGEWYGPVAPPGTSQSAALATLRGELEETRRQLEKEIECRRIERNGAIANINNTQSALDAERSAHETTRRQMWADLALKNEVICAERAARKEAERERGVALHSLKAAAGVMSDAAHLLRAGRDSEKVADFLEAISQKRDGEVKTMREQRDAAEAEVVRLREALRRCQRLTLNRDDGPSWEVHETCIAALAPQTTDPSETTETPT